MCRLRDRGDRRKVEGLGAAGRVARRRGKPNAKSGHRRRRQGIQERLKGRGQPCLPTPENVVAKFIEVARWASKMSVLRGELIVSIYPTDVECRTSRLLITQPYC